MPSHPSAVISQLRIDAPEFVPAPPLPEVPELADEDLDLLIFCPMDSKRMRSYQFEHPDTVRKALAAFHAETLADIPAIVPWLGSTLALRSPLA